MKVFLPAHSSNRNCWWAYHSPTPQLCLTPRRPAPPWNPQMRHLCLNTPTCGTPASELCLALRDTLFITVFNSTWNRRSVLHTAAQNFAYLLGDMQQARTTSPRGLLLPGTIRPVKTRDNNITNGRRQAQEDNQQKSVKFGTNRTQLT